MDQGLGGAVAGGNGARGGAGKAPVDRVHLARYTLGNLELETEVLQLFVEQAPMTLASLGSAVTPRDWHAAAHTLKGSARAVGAWAVAECAERAERLTPGSDSREKAAAVAAVEAALAEVVAYIDKLEAVA